MITWLDKETRHCLKSKYRSDLNSMLKNASVIQINGARAQSTSNYQTNVIILSARRMRAFFYGQIKATKDFISTPSLILIRLTLYVVVHIEQLSWKGCWLATITREAFFHSSSNSLSSSRSQQLFCQNEF